jgi:glucose-6-phosphate 1-dehydrogenase
MAHEGSSGWRHVVVEKPFGRDLASAQALNAAMHAVFQEHQIYRIDHYPGKETAQNILYFRVANTIFEPIWNRNYVDNMQITVAESVDVGHRAGYYDQAGVLRDMFQNHLMQLLALVAMEPPLLMFESLDDGDFTSNALSICIQPDEGIHLQFEAKAPDLKKTDSVDMEFHYHSAFEGSVLPSAYERLLSNAIRGDAALFACSDGIEASWRLMDPVLQGWDTAVAPPVVTYEPGLWEPVEADGLLGRDGRVWVHGCGNH